MGFFRQMGNAMARFMYGRNGMDQLNRALLALYLILYLVRTVVILVFRSALLARIADILLWVLVVLILFRMISKNLPKRRQENQKWMGWWWKIRSRGSGARARHADKEHTNTLPAKTARPSAGCRWGRARSSSPVPNAARRFMPRADGHGTKSGKDHQFQL